MTMKVGIIGVGKLGQPVGEVMALHHEVLGYDIEAKKPQNFRMASKLKELIDFAEIIFIAAPTPHDSAYDGSQPIRGLENKDFDYSAVRKILKQVDELAGNNPLVVLISTVLPGTCRREFVPLCRRFRFIYNPYLIAMGTVKWDFVNPEMIMIGTDRGEESKDAKSLIRFYRPMMENLPRIVIGTWDEAEAIKIFYNTFISAKLSIVNMIQDVAQRNGNMNVDVITKALAESQYRIMGPAYMKAGMGDGGPCHPRDNIALRFMAERLNLGYDLFDAIMQSREVQAENLAKFLLKYSNNVTIVGKSYKPGVAFTDGSYSLLVGHFVEKEGGCLTYYDPNTGDLDVPPKTGDRVYLIGYWEDWVEDFHWQFDATVVDPWRRLTTERKDLNLVHYGNTRKFHSHPIDDYNHRSTASFTYEDKRLRPY